MHRTIILVRSASFASQGRILMQRLALVLSLFLFCVAALHAQAPVSYGSNPDAGGRFTHDGIRLYYEVYGSGEPILLVHGNGLSIASFKAQIEYFRKHYKVIAMDSRDKGRSASWKSAKIRRKLRDAGRLLARQRPPH